MRTVQQRTPVKLSICNNAVIGIGNIYFTVPRNARNPVYIMVIAGIGLEIYAVIHIAKSDVFNIYIIALSPNHIGRGIG